MFNFFFFLREISGTFKGRFLGKKISEKVDTPFSVFFEQVSQNPFERVVIEPYLQQVVHGEWNYW